MDDEEAASRWLASASILLLDPFTSHSSHAMLILLLNLSGSPQSRRYTNRPIIRHFLPYQAHPRPRRTRPPKPTLDPNPSLRSNYPPIRIGPTSSLPDRLREYALDRRSAGHEGTWIHPPEEGCGGVERVGWC